MDQSAGVLLQVLGMEKMKKTTHRFLVLLSQDDCLPAVASVAVVEAGEKGGEKGARRREEQGVRQEWFSTPFHEQSHIKVDQWN